MPNYAKFLKDVMAKKTKSGKYETVDLTENCSAIIQKGLPNKHKDPGSFTLSCVLGNNVEGGKEGAFDTWKTISSHGGSHDRRPEGGANNAMHNETITFKIYDALKFLRKEGAEGYQEELEVLPERIPQKRNIFLPLRTPEEEEEKKETLTTPRGPPKVELKPLPEHLRYAFLGPDNTYPVVLSAALSEKECEKLLCVLNKYRSAIGWSIGDLKRISPTTCMHSILLEEGHKPRVQNQHRLNPIIQDVVRKKVIKLLDAVIIYAISDSEWVSPMQVVAKKRGMTVVPGKDGEMIATRVATGWKVCIDYRMLNAATRKYHFPLPFIDQMLYTLRGYDYYCFLDGYSGYNKIAIAPEDQHKSAFTCPYGIYAYRKMSFGLCNALATFQRCMMANFHDLI
ncbi:uncharacterized protein LOC121746809 [Salvia splendens]|uniref:uncharacterized protein LOC121746809 n=1 Tax=Salvia splendens TaxID=180675 RepID=UPI001C25F76E|nr:uncharacterized protein LOC121746809 [Salvia splendens]